MSRLLEDLNDAQKEAVQTIDGPLLIIAGAGSGKTRVLTRRMAYMITERGVQPHQILAVTFTNKAAGEMKERVVHLLGGQLPGLTVSTFHSFCALFLRREAEFIGYDKTYTIFDAADSLTLVKNCIKELNLSSSQFTPKAQMRKISNSKNQMVGAGAFAEAASGYFENTTSEIYKLYQTRLRQCNAMDFDDLLYNTVALLQSNTEVRTRYRNRFQYLMVDEYQDTNHVQYLLIKALLNDHNNLCVVGDEDQAIYGWRGADIRNILDFEKDFENAKIIKLEQNYRSTNVILKAASAVISNNTARKDKKLWTSDEGGSKIQLFLVDSAQEEAHHLLDTIKNNGNGVRLSEIAILYRTNAQSRPFEEQLRLKNIPYQIVGGISFYQRKEIKDLMAYLKLIANIKDDISFERVINYPKRGIGAKSIADIRELAQKNNCSCYELILQAENFPELGSKQKKLIPFVKIIEDYRKRQETDPIDIFASDLIEDIKLLDEFKEEEPTIGQTRVENIEAFLEGMADYARAHPESSVAEYLSEISLFTDLDSYEGIDEKITLMTIHSAKGLEYDSVYIVGLEEGLFPLGQTIGDEMALEEERRLLYVGATRARKHLYLSAATTRHRFGEVESIPSRFLKEIPEELIEKKDFRTRRSLDYSTGSTSVNFQRYQKKTEPAATGIHYEYEAEEIMRTGRIVQHPTFGRGKIVNAEGFGESLRLEIMFTGLGIKKIMAKYAKLKIVG